MQSKAGDTDSVIEDRESFAKRYLNITCKENEHLFRYPIFC